VSGTERVGWRKKERREGKEMEGKGAKEGK